MAALTTKSGPAAQRIRAYQPDRASRNTPEPPPPEPTKPIERWASGRWGLTNIETYQLVELLESRSAVPAVMSAAPCPCCEAAVPHGRSLLAEFTMPDEGAHAPYG